MRTCPSFAPNSPHRTPRANCPAHPHTHSLRPCLGISHPEFGPRTLPITRRSPSPSHGSARAPCRLPHIRRPLNQAGAAAFVQQMATMMSANLHDFAYFPGAPADKFKLAKLASLLLDNPEDWKNVDERGVEHPYGVLQNYVLYSFAYIADTQPEKLKYSTNGEHVVFDTRLTSSLAAAERSAAASVAAQKLMPIYMLFGKNRNVGMQPWCFQGWCAHVCRGESIGRVTQG